MDAVATLSIDSWMKLHGTDGFPFIIPHSSSKCRQWNRKLLVVRKERRAGPDWRVNLDPED
jgi:hypothetical protein